ncbi:SMP-30/gluconolactonase/LRE family protein [Emticicia sp. SJ17W-69]|uniref:SMP-30/gluconolactonase/LRE family protein n=1 Tax=Emticicia sp. SJ17W-69 TaxID=3421657 RepID=UPI003EC01296
MKLWLKISIVLLTIILIFVGRTLLNAGFFTKIDPHFNGSVSEIAGFHGAEDITIDKAKGLALISSSDFSTDMPNGAIYLLNLNEIAPKPIKLTEKLPFDDFHPHGISLFKAINGTKKLFVVNHRKTGNFIEIFQFTDSTLVHLESITDPLFVSPNDIVGVGERTFYLTNDHDEVKSDWRSKKDLLQIPMGNACYFDGKKASILAKGFLYANGINTSLDGRKLFVAATSGQKIKVFDRDVSTGSLTESDEIAINGADNIELDEVGNLWVGCHPKLLAYLAHSKDHSKPSPSEIIKINYQSKGKVSLESVYLNDGKPVSGSSVGAVFGDKLLIGSVFGNKVLLCTLKK